MKIVLQMKKLNNLRISASLTLPGDLLAVETEQAESRHDDHRLDDDEEDDGHQDLGHVLRDQLEEEVQTALQAMIRFNGARLTDDINIFIIESIDTKRIIANNLEITLS